MSSAPSKYVDRYILYDTGSIKCLLKCRFVTKANLYHQKYGVLCVLLATANRCLYNLIKTSCFILSHIYS